VKHGEYKEALPSLTTKIEDLLPKASKQWAAKEQLEAQEMAAQDELKVQEVMKAQEE
jgi:hypothetical protein